MNQALLSLLNQSNLDVGHQLVSPGFHADHSFLSDEARESASLFDSKMLGHQYHPELVPLEVPSRGATQKVHFRVGGKKDESGKVQPSSTFMVKPYYENLASDQTGRYPLAGWAEMAWHGILNASDMGHTSMRIHSFPYHNSALLAVELDPDMHGIYQAGGNAKEKWNPITGHGYVNFPPNLKDDAARLGALDFLLNNQDRNRGNLMMRVDPFGKADSLMAIDNGRSMQYMESNSMHAPYVNEDGLLHYLNAPAYRHVLGNDLHAPLSTISQWWKQHKMHIVGEFHKHLEGIKHIELATHIGESFYDRVGALDNVVSDFKEHGADPYKEHSKGNSDSSNSPIVQRASVRVRPWKPEDDPMPATVQPDNDRHPVSCPSCGEDYEEKPWK
jgi:hypothetical protein